MPHRHPYLGRQRVVLSFNAPAAQWVPAVSVLHTRGDLAALVLVDPEARVGLVVRAHAVRCIRHAPSPVDHPRVDPAEPVLALAHGLALPGLADVPALVDRVPVVLVV
jgi:hypothetical protein